MQGHETWATVNKVNNSLTHILTRLFILFLLYCLFNISGIANGWWMHLASEKLVVTHKEEMGETFRASGPSGHPHEPDTILPSVSAIGLSGWFKSWSFFLVLGPLGVPQGPGLCPLLFLPLTRDPPNLSHLLHIPSSCSRWRPPSSSLSHALLSTMGVKAYSRYNHYYILLCCISSALDSITSSELEVVLGTILYSACSIRLNT